MEEKKRFKYSGLTSNFGKDVIARVCEKHGGNEPPVGYLPAEYLDSGGNWCPIYIAEFAVPRDCR